MTGENVRDTTYFGVPVEEYPEPCQSCAELAEFVELSGNLDLTNQPLYLLPEAKRYRQIARMVFPYLDTCNATCCGIRSARALHKESNLE